MLQFRTSISYIKNPFGKEFQMKKKTNFHTMKHLRYNIF